VGKTQFPPAFTIAFHLPGMVLLWLPGEQSVATEARQARIRGHRTSLRSDFTSTTVRANVRTSASWADVHRSVFALPRIGFTSVPHRANVRTSAG
jgi:hypothetical protein